MLLKEVVDIFDILDSSYVNGFTVKELLEKVSKKGNIEVETICTSKGSTDFIRITIPGKNGKINGGKAPTLLVVGRLGGLGTRPNITGFVSDGDGALTVLSLALKLLKMKERGDDLEGDILISTHITPNAPTLPHDPVDFMDSPVDMRTMNEKEVFGDFDAMLSVDTTKGNNIINNNGFAISPTVREGYILKVSDDLLRNIEKTTGESPKVFAITTQDITPYGNGVYHLNSILQPSIVTDKPVVGVAITSGKVIAGCDTEATSPISIESCARFLLSVSKEFTLGKVSFSDDKEFELLQKLYGDMKSLQKN